MVTIDQAFGGWRKAQKRFLMMAAYLIKYTADKNRGRCDEETHAAANKRKRILPGFGLSLGVTLVYVSAIVVIPLSMVFIWTASLGAEGFGRYLPMQEY